jgi:REP element-mobilizing transposase RayT
LRLEFSGALYHITSRGNAKQSIFLDDWDRENFLTVLATVVDRYNWLCHAYCLMHNHYHLVVETPDANLSSGMRQLNGVYTQKFNNRHERVGHLFQGRYKSILVEKHRHLLSLCRYVVLNPVRSGTVRRPEEWAWSSYGPTIGSRNCPSFLTTEWILSQFGDNAREAMAKYRRFVLDGLRAESPWKSLKGRLCLGSAAFLKEMYELTKGKKSLGEIPSVQKYAGRPELEELFADVTSRGREARNKLIHIACVRHGYSLKEIADHLGLHYTTVSVVLRRFEETRGKTL